MAGQVAEEVKEERRARLQCLLEAQKNAFNEAQVGNILPVLFHKPGRRPGQLVGRSPYLQSVHVRAPQSMLGSIAPARITGATPNALAGALARQDEAAA
jgi:tRNA-2-methylthio-N6-dimethylallyladenosine synthase